MTTINNFKTTTSTDYGRYNTVDNTSNKTKVEKEVDLPEETKVSLNAAASLSSAALSTDVPFDADKVASIKAQIAVGTFVMDSSKIANKILESLIK